MLNIMSHKNKLTLLLTLTLAALLTSCAYVSQVFNKEHPGSDKEISVEPDRNIDELFTYDNGHLRLSYGEDIDELLGVISTRDQQIDSLYTLLDYLYFKSDSLSQELEYYSGRLTLDSGFEVPRKFVFAEREFNMNSDRMHENFKQIFNEELKAAHLFIPRSGIYFPVFDSVFTAYNLPNDLKYLAIAESRLNSVATSPVGAGGVWQFMPATAKHYKLQVDNFIDERRDIFKATDAAARYLTNSYKYFQNRGAEDWLLAMCAYNAGDGSIARVMREQQANDFFDLIMRVDETNRYVWRAAAIKLIFDNEEQLFGTKFEREPSIYETTRIEKLVLKGYYKLDDWAIAQGTVLRRVWELNPWIKLSRQQRQRYSAINNLVLPAGEYQILLPIESQKNEAKVAEIEKRFLTQSSDYFASHTVQKGETLSSIARRYNTSVTNIKNLNNLRSDMIYPGQKLQLMGSATSSASAGSRTYTVKKGDTIDLIARRFNVTTAQLISRNNLKQVTRNGKRIVIIHPGQRITY
ncbi:MAG: LysM peptidoglycan-binding domain-containing protein [Candidatus Cloacimonadia bacterium]